MTAVPAAGVPAPAAGAAGGAAPAAPAAPLAPGAAPTMAGATPGVSVPATPPASSLTQVYTDIFVNSCAVCHAMAPDDRVNGNFGGITNKEALHAAIVGKSATSTACASRGTLIVPFQPVQSLLFQILTSTPPCGQRMPLGMTPLTDAQLAVLEGWIMAGAPNN